MVVARERVLVLNPQAGGLSEEAEGELLGQFAGFDFLRLEEGQDLAALISGSDLAPDATVVVAGGDGTVRAAARALAGSRRSLGIVPLGTFNNFARALGIPLEAEPAARAILGGRPVGVALGRVGGEPFLEAASLGLFGDLINLGEAAKDLHYGELLQRVRELSSPSFDYRITGDLEQAGRARAIVVANTPSTGALVPVGSVTPEEPVLELSILRAGRRLEILRRLAAHALPFLDEPEPGRRIRRVRIETDPPISVYADATQVGDTPAEIEIDLQALRVVLPA
jgi:diacylglycerol kinase family enzyme